MIEDKLHEGQLDMLALVERIQSSDLKKGVIRTGRRFGKTYFLVWYAVRTCMMLEGIRFPFIAPTIKALKSVVLPIFQEVLKGCPKALRPEFKRQDGVFVFPNGSEIPLAGTDSGHAEKIRGTKAHSLVLDEAGFMTDLKYVVNDICLPTLLYSEGLMIAASTPPTSPDHYFVEMLMDAEIKNATIHKTIWDNPMLTRKDILQAAEGVGCVIDWDQMEIVEKSIAFRREFEAEILVDPDSAVIPEFTEEKAERIVKERDRPPYCNKYIIIDTGYIDFTAVVFGYWDFDRAKAVIEDDMLINFSQGGMNTEKLASQVIAKAKALWGDASYLCHGDGDLIVLHELSRYGLPCSPVRKDNLEAQVNSARIDFQNEKIVISPKAVNVIAHCKYGVWNKRRNAFDRTENHGHFDALAATIYFLRHVNKADNPYPADYRVDHFRDHIQDGYLESRDKLRNIKKLVNIRQEGK